MCPVDIGLCYFLGPHMKYTKVRSLEIVSVHTWNRSHYRFHLFFQQLVSCFIISTTFFLVGIWEFMGKRQGALLPHMVQHRTVPGIRYFGNKKKSTWEVHQREWKFKGHGNISGDSWRRSGNTLVRRGPGPFREEE